MPMNGWPDDFEDQFLPEEGDEDDDRTPDIMQTNETCVFCPTVLVMYSPVSGRFYCRNCHITYESVTDIRTLRDTMERLKADHEQATGKAFQQRAGARSVYR